MEMKKHWKFFIIILCTFVFLGMLIFYNIEDDLIIVAYDSEISLKSKSSPYIFFIESSGANFLNARQACAVESTARHNAWSNIQVIMFTTDSIEDRFELNRTFSNIAFLQTKMDDVFSGTPLKEWYEEGSWKNNSNAVLHLSDASRLALIWKFGGIYLDLDIVMLRSMLGLRNFLIQQREEEVCNGVFGFDDKHPFILNNMYNLNKLCKKQANSFGCGGPPMFNAVLKSMCGNGKKIKENNCNIRILPMISAFPVPFVNWRDYFNNSSTTEISQKMKDSYLIHVWNYLSSEEPLRIRSGSAYEQAIESNCPLVYKKMLNNSDFL